MVKFLIQRPIATTVTCIAFIVMSLVAANMLPVSLLPDIDIPEVIVKLDATGESARQIEERYTTKVRRQLLQVSHVEDMESSSINNQAIIRLKFNYGTDIKYSVIEVNEKIDALMHSMPSSFKRPRVIKTSATDIPVFYLHVNLKDSTNSTQFMELSEFCEQVIKKRVEQLSEVAMVDISGTEHSEIVLKVDIEKLEHLGIDRTTFSKALETNNYSVGNIKVRNGLYEFNVRYASLLKNRFDIENLNLWINKRLFKLKDLASIQVRPRPGAGVYLANQKKAVAMAVIKKSNARVADLRQKTTELLDNLEKDYPRLEFKIERNQTALLDYSIRNLKYGLLLGAGLAFLVMFIFLKDLKSPILIEISVPLSLIISLLLFYLFNLSINVISLSGLILGMGMIIDNSIIVIDNISQYRAKGFAIAKAVVKGTNEVMRPLISSVLTTCAVFVPLVFLSGISGALFFDQAMAVSIGLCVSLLVSFTVIPVYYFLFYRNTKEKKKQGNIFKWLNVYHYFENSYSTLFTILFKYRIVFFIAISGLVIGGYFVLGKIQKEKFPAFNQTSAEIRIDWNRNITIEENYKRVAEFLLSQKDILQSSSGMIGPQNFILGQTNTISTSEAIVYLETKTESELQKSLSDFIQFCKTKYPETLIHILSPETIFEKVFSDKSSPLEIRLRSNTNNKLPTLPEIKQITKQIKEQTQFLPSNPPNFQEYLEIKPDYERLLLYNVNVSELISVLKKSFNRLQIFTLKQGQIQTPVFFAGEEKEFFKIIQSAKVKSKTKDYIPISALVSVATKSDYKTFTGKKSDSHISLYYDVSTDDAYKITSACEQALSQYPHIVLEKDGSIISNKKLFKELLLILIVSVLLLYFILAAQFESLSLPLIVLLEIPIDIAGALLLLYFTGNSLNLMAFIGIIVMIGIIINDSILKIDTINRLVKSGNKLMDAIHLGGKRRLKPIIMTSITTILAMVPFLFGNDLGSALQKPLAWSIIGGMTIGTFISLYFIPICYYYLMRNKK